MGTGVDSTGVHGKGGSLKAIECGCERSLLVVLSQRRWSPLYVSLNLLTGSRFIKTDAGLNFLRNRRFLIHLFLWGIGHDHKPQRQHLFGHSLHCSESFYCFIDCIGDMDIKWQRSVESNPQILKTVLSLQAFDLYTDLRHTLNPGRHHSRLGKPTSAPPSSPQSISAY